MSVWNRYRPRPPWPLVASLLGLCAAACVTPPVDYVGKTCDVQDDCPSDLVCDPVSKTCQKTASAADAGGPVDAGGSLDGGTLRQPVASVTAGGGALSSANYRLQVYVAPTTPVGALTSPGYRLQLGPAPAVR